MTGLAGPSTACFLTPKGEPSRRKVVRTVAGEVLSTMVAEGRKVFRRVIKDVLGD